MMDTKNNSHKQAKKTGNHYEPVQKEAPSRSLVRWRDGGIAEHVLLLFLDEIVCPGDQQHPAQSRISIHLLCCLR